MGKRSAVTTAPSDESGGELDSTESITRSSRKRRTNEDEQDTSEEDSGDAEKTPQSRSSRGRKQRKSVPEENEEDADNEKTDESDDVSEPKDTGDSSTAKRSKNGKDETGYEVEAVVDDRIIKGRVQYKIRWKGYSSEDDTWENESALECSELIEEYNDRGDSSGASTSKKSGKTKKKKVKSPSKKSRKIEPGPSQSGEWEILRIIDMHTFRNGKHEFLVRWKGFSPDCDTWEPEENLSGTDLIEKFLSKVEKLKEIPDKELRVQRKPTDRYIAMPQGDKRRESKRYSNKRRVRYFDAE